MTRRILTALPVYNEEKYLLDVLPVVKRYSQDVLVVDDGSSDRTPHLLAEMEGIAVIRHPQNQGYGAGLKSAFQFAIDNGYDALVTIDCDGQHEPRLIPEIAAALWPADGRTVDLVSGSRYLQVFDGDSTPPEARRKVNMEITAQLNRCFGCRSRMPSAASRLTGPKRSRSLTLLNWVTRCHCSCGSRRCRTR